MIAAVLMGAGGLGAPVHAADVVEIKEGDTAMTVSPMRRDAVLNPGETYHGSLWITNPSVAVHDLYYKLTIKPFYVDENYNPVYEDMDGNSEIAKWLTLDSPARGAVKPNETAKVDYTINVPLDAPVGGQYVSIVVSTDFEAAASEGINIGEVMSIAHLVLARIGGEERIEGEVVGAGVDSLVMDGKIKAYSLLKNTGNVHAMATYKLEVSPIFSPDALYSNEEAPETHYVLPDRTYYNETVWDQTPMVGIFDVVYAVEYQGETTEIAKVVIVCPLWLMVALGLLLVAIVIRIIYTVKRRAKKKQKKQEKLENAKIAENNDEK